MLRVGRTFGLRRVRVPAEPPSVLAACGMPPGLGARALHAWCGVLREQVRAAGMTSADAVFGLAWSGHMTEPRLLRPARQPAGRQQRNLFPPGGRGATRRWPR